MILPSEGPEPDDGIELCDGTNYGPPCQTFTYTSNETCIYFDNMDNRAESLRFLGSYRDNYEALMYGDASCSVYNARYGQDTPDFGAGLNNQFSSMRIERHQPPSCDPSADQVALFVDANYSGQCVVKDIGEYPTPGAIGLPNDSISSIKVGGNVKAILCRDDNYSGGCETFTSDDPDLGNNSIGNDQVSSVKVESRTGGCNPNADQVALYADTGYGGSCVTLDIRDYPNPGHLSDLGNDNAESVKVGSNVQAILCEHDSYEGRCETFTGDDSNLSANYIGANVVSSVRVQSDTPTPTRTPTATSTNTSTPMPTATHTPTSTPAPTAVSLNLVINGIEVSQATQRTDNGVPLVADRPVVVRVYVGVQNSTSVVPGVTARLHAARGGSELADSPIAPFNSGGSFTAPLTPNREQFGDTLNFQFPASWIGIGQLTLWVEVNPDRTVAEADYGDNCSADYTPSFQNVPSLQVVLIPIAYQQNGQGPVYRPILDTSNNFGLGTLEPLYPIVYVQRTIHSEYMFRGNLSTAEGWSQLIEETSMPLRGATKNENGSRRAIDAQKG